MIFRLILPDWAKEQHPELPKVLEGEFTDEQIEAYNIQGYNVYFLPNYPSVYDPSTVVDGSHVDTFNVCYVDVDLKDGQYPNKEGVLDGIEGFPLPPTFINDSGNGIHAYWQVSDLDAMNFLKLQRRLCRRFRSDEAVSKIFQLMRMPGTINNKDQDNPKLCNTIFEDNKTYTCEQLSAVLPPITQEDEAYCQQHYNKTYKINDLSAKIDEVIPPKFLALLRNSKEVKDIWSSNVDDRSKADFRLGHIMFASGFSKEEALSVLVNSEKALSRSPAHRLNYATGIVEKIWTYELLRDDKMLALSSTVKEILERSGENLKGTRFACNAVIDDTVHGFRLGQVIGLVAGSGVGKTAMALNMFMWFAERNPDYEHFFVPLEQPTNEIADRWKKMCGDNTALHDKVHVISNYAEDGSFRHLSFEEIKEYLLKFKETTGKKIGCVVIDHIGALRKAGKHGENQDIMDVCHNMKAFALETNTLLIMQSQSNREKAGIGDLELDKNAAYGSVFFESYCDYLIAIWQPLKRCYVKKECPSVMAFKFCKIRHKNKDLDKIQEDERYILAFDSKTETLREVTQEEENAFKFWNQQATNKRKGDRKTDLLVYTTIRSNNGTPTHDNK